jgi:serine protease AprX
VPPQPHGQGRREPVIGRRVLEDLIFRRAPMRRYTQDCPILPDVWFEYGRDPLSQVDLLLTPRRGIAPGQVATAIQARLSQERDSPSWTARHNGESSATQLVYSQSTVAGWFWFDELARVILPLSVWESVSRTAETASLAEQWLELPATSPAERATLAADLQSMESGGRLDHAAELVWMIRIVGTIERARRSQASDEQADDVADTPLGRTAASELVEFVVDLLAGAPPLGPTTSSIFSVSRNRQTMPAVWRSVPAIKADAARWVFKLDCTDLRWAVIDSGIDASHPAFRRRDLDGRQFKEPFQDLGEQPKNNTRVVATYDFTRIRKLLDPDQIEAGGGTPELAEQLRGMELTPQELARHLRSGRRIDWDIFGPLLQIPHEADAYRPPAHEHGTHVAGILAADWKASESEGVIDHDLTGVCPDVRLYDIRVLDDQGIGDEFSIIAALQFVRYLNANQDTPVIHGVNLSLSIPHDIANYACGRTPVCEECERVVGSGVVVVAAAGNEGYIQYLTSAGLAEGYRNISITDPGNTEGVITVGSTHRYRPHTYGVSYFSSRGPTGDGRRKPDLVAPGEKIWSAVPDGSVRTLDGTSMAAPHVSGCAILILARHRELLGQPDRIKQILCSTSTDLGRERYFQGCGMVDVLRAIQSV